MKKLSILLCTILLGGCAQKQESANPLKNTKKLIVKGHTSLYNNGMMTIPYTKLNVIPAINSTVKLSHKLFFEDGKEALQKALQNAMDSIYLIPSGSKKAYRISGSVYTTSNELSQEIRNYTQEKGIYMISRSSLLAKEHITGSFDTALDMGKEMVTHIDSLEESIDTKSDAYFFETLKSSGMSYERTQQNIKRISSESMQSASADFQDGVEDFVTGYYSLGSQLAENLSDMNKSISSQRFVSAYNLAEAKREKQTLYFSDIVANTVQHYGEDSAKSFDKATNDFGTKVENEGLILSSLKSVRWLLQGLVYEGVLKPVVKVAGSSVGLISVNGVIYPVQFVANELQESAEVIVEVSYLGVKSGYEIIAPSFRFALASLLSGSEFVGGQLSALSVATVGTTVSATKLAVGTTTAAGGKTAATLLGKGSKYIAVPLAVSARAVGEIGYGVIASSSMATLGTGVIAGGEATALATQGSGTIASGSTLAVGSAYSFVNAAAHGIYHLAEAVIVPTGYTLSSGTVLGYGGISQLQAHTILAAGDAAYMILSLEGPKWVIYTISGDDNKSMPAGAIVDLNKAQKQGRVIKRLDVSDGEIEKVLSVMGELE
jgi:hypothetical protein